MESRVSKSKFKAQALEIFRRIEATGEPVIVTDHGKPCLIVSKYAVKAEGARKRLEGLVLRYDDPLEPVSDSDWEALA